MSQETSDQYEPAEIQEMEDALTRAMVLDKVIYNPGDSRAELAAMRMHLTKLEYMVAFLLGQQVKEMFRSPRPGEVVMGDPATTKIKYQRSALQEWHGGPWKKYLEDSLKQFETPAPPPQAGQPEGGNDGKEA